jgi:hypothetical protein
MVRSILIGATLLATTAFIAIAQDRETITEEKRDYRAQVVETGADHQGREYVSNGVLVIEGAPRWTEFRQTSSTTNRTGSFLDPLAQIFD